MARCLGLVILAVTALAQERPLSDLQILKWHVEAQARERSVTRRLDDSKKRALWSTKPRSSARAQEKPREAIRAENGVATSASRSGRSIRR